MANYNQIRYGSTGDDVKKLQELMNQNGYTLDTDGIFGSQTENAVRDYQKKNGLDVDGIVGENTWGKLYGSETTNENTQNDPNNEPQNDSTQENKTKFNYDPYQKSDAVTQAERLLQEHMDKKTGSYQSNWQSQIDDILNRILNREDFSYDMNQDAFFQQAADLYKLQGQQAMMDTMGQAAAMTGGYGNTFAQSAGQQAYQGYLQQINNMLPEFRQQALDLYNLEGQRMADDLSMMMGKEEQDYGRWNDENNRYLEELQRLSDETKYLEEQDYARWANERDFQYGQHRDNTSDEQWNKEYEFAMQQYEDSKVRNGSSSGGGGNEENSTGGYQAPDGWDEEKIKQFQEEHGLEADGIWGPKTQAAYEESSVPDKGWNDYDEKTHEQNVKDNGGSYYQETLNTLKLMKSQGKSDAEIRSFLEEAVGNSYLSRSEYLTLFNKYRDGKL